MYRFYFILKQVVKGKSITRAFLNERLLAETLSGKTIDIGGGAGNAYLAFMDSSDSTHFTTFDLRNGDMVDFESEPLPSEDGVFDTVLFLNVMEHIFNYQHIANEVVRITKPGGQVLGFVPFLMWYHPDHKDFFRYTHEALEKIFQATGAASIKIEPIEKGLFTAAFHIKALAFPLFLRVPLFSFAYVVDSFIGLFKKERGPKYVLGYFFKLTK